ncbi:hypothetical protein [Amycolatopsis sp. NPDC098790]|uniref:hypothetical protein n=1 Tax=Amycolatopsis sp. NPDC098790 TaxID=3363939 RepID=UPI003802619B
MPTPETVNVTHQMTVPRGPLQSSADRSVHCRHDDRTATGSDPAVGGTPVTHTEEIEKREQDALGRAGHVTSSARGQQ